MISIENVLGVNIYIYSIYNMPYAISIIIYSTNPVICNCVTD